MYFDLVYGVKKKYSCLDVSQRCTDWIPGCTYPLKRSHQTRGHTDILKIEVRRPIRFLKMKQVKPCTLKCPAHIYTAFRITAISSVYKPVPCIEALQLQSLTCENAVKA